MRLKLREFGDDCEGIQLKGDKRYPEPDQVRIAFPGGDVDVVRTTNNEYWVHLRVNRKDSTTYDPSDRTAKVVDGRIDLISKHASETDEGDLDHPDLYHVAVRVAIEGG